MMTTKKKPLKILQLAAYGSNIGDNANISGIRATLIKNFPEHALIFDDWDIVDFSWSLDDFDDETVTRINHYDLFIIGGGGFLELIPGSQTWTGTRINIPKAIFERITVPTIFYSLGIDTVRADLDGRDISQEIKKFRSFVEFIGQRKNILLSTRHDGSLNVLDKILDEQSLKLFSLVPDGGFFTTHQAFKHPELASDKINVAINFGGDLLPARFCANYPSMPKRNNPLNIKRPKDYENIDYQGHAGYTQFLISFANIIRQLSFELKDIQFVFVPHIYRDIETGFNLLSEVGFPYCRREMTMAPYIQGFEAKDYIVDLYRQCDLSIGMRFHANVCPIAVATPSIGLGTFPMIQALYSSLDLDQQYLQVSAGPDFEQQLYTKIQSSLNNSHRISEQYKQVTLQLAKTNDAFHQKIKALI